jgi:hypothetical protein
VKYGLPVLDDQQLRSDKLAAGHPFDNLIADPIQLLAGNTNLLWPHMGKRKRD